MDTPTVEQLAFRVAEAVLKGRSVSEAAAEAIRAAVLAEREQWRGWCRALFGLADRHVPIREFPDELDDARRALEEP